MHLRSCGRRGLFCLVLALALSGCGRRGDLQPPPDVPASQVVPLQVQNINPVAGDPAQPGRKVIQQNGPYASTATNGKSFFLDPLVK